MNFFPTPCNPQKDYFDENTNSIFDGNTIVQDEGNSQYDFRKITVGKDEKKIKTKGEKKENQLFSNLQKQLKEKKLKLLYVHGDRKCFFRAIAHQLYGHE